MDKNESFHVKMQFGYPSDRCLYLVGSKVTLGLGSHAKKKLGIFMMERGRGLAGSPLVSATRTSLNFLLELP